MNRQVTQLILMMTMAWSAIPPASAQQVDKSKARKVKAAFLYKFAKFVHWPDNAFEDDNAPIVIGVLGADPFGRVLDETVKGKRIGKRLIEIRRFQWNDKDRKRMRGCHILFISSSERQRHKAICEALVSHPMLIVGDVEGFAANGGMIGFVLEKKSIAFQINQAAADRAHLSLSARLLKLATIIKP